MSPTGPPRTADLSPATRIDALAEHSGKRIAVVYEGGTYSYRVLADHAATLALELADRGARSGDRIGYLGGNSVTFLAAYLAASRLGAIFVPVNSRLTSAEIAVILDDCAPHTLIVEPGHREVADGAVAATTATPTLLLVHGDPAIGVDDPGAPWTTLPRVRAGDRTVPPALRCDESRLAMLAYTSGTTGRPKGVSLTHGNLWWNCANMDLVAPAAPNDVTLVVAPLFHTAPFGCFVLRTLLRGGTIVLRRGFDAEQMLADLVGYRISTVFAVPAMYAAVADLADFPGVDLSALRTAVVAGAPATGQLVSRYLDRGIALQQAYGLTETLFASCLPAERTAENPGSAGLALPFTEIRLIDPATGEQLTRPGDRGEVCLRAPTVTAEYWNNPDATAAAFDADDWFRTGDIGYVDRHGCLYLVDRRKDMIIVGGDNVYSAEVEQVLTRFPGATDVAVVGVPDPHEGESVVAVLSCRSGVAPSLAEIRRFAEPLLARYKLPTQVVLAGQIPRNAMGKIDKVAIRAALVAGEDSVFRADTGAANPEAGAADRPMPAPVVERTPRISVRTATPSEPIPDWLRELPTLAPDAQHRIVFELVADAIARTIRGAPTALNADDRLGDLGLGSLAAVELAKRLGAALRRNLPSTMLFEHATVGALVHHLRTRVLTEPVEALALDRLAELERALLTDPPQGSTRAELRARLRGSLDRLAAEAAGSPPTTPNAVADATDDELFALLDAELDPARVRTTGAGVHP
ncbi:AMP-binding protein [Nocardia aurea]|uniref:AMP-binding protein n=1 Tax=Nocardia aurea TaxID=2144174 RepID=UPI0033A87E67